MKKLMKESSDCFCWRTEWGRGAKIHAQDVQCSVAYGSGKSGKLKNPATGEPIKENWLNEWKSIHSKDTKVKPLRMVWLALTLALTWRENDNILLNTK